MASTLFITKPGEMLHPWLNKADTKYNDDGLYHVDLVLEGNDAEDLKAKIDGASKAFLDEHTDEMKPAEAKKWSLYVPYEPGVDDEGNEDGTTVFHFKQNAKITLKDGSTKDITIELRDSKDKIIETPVYSGSEGRVMFSMRGITIASQRQAGVRLDFYKVQITKLVKGSGKSKGFGEYEGGYEAEAGDAGFGESEPEGDY